MDNSEFCKDMMRFFNGLMSPLLVPSYISLCIFMLSVLHLVAPGAALPYTLTVFGATGVVPFVAVMMLRKVGAAGSYELYSRPERVIPYILYFLALGAVTLFFIFKGANAWIWTIFCGGAAATLANFLINFWIRVSCRCSAMAALVAALLVVNRYGVPQESLFWWIVGAVFFAGLAGTLAVVVGRHALKDVLIGYATGFLGVILFTLIR